MTTRDYIMSPKALKRPALKVLNLSRSYAYQTLGYYGSLLGVRAVTVDTWIGVVREGRGKRLKESPEMFSGLFWTGAKSIDMGLADELGVPFDHVRVVTRKREFTPCAASTPSSSTA